MTDSAFIPKPLFRIACGKKELIFLVAWFDFWVGVYFDPKNRSFYICPLPCCVFYIGERKAP